MELMRLLHAWLLSILFIFVDTAEQRLHLGPLEVLTSIKDLLFPPQTNAVQGERDRRDANGQNDMEFSLPMGLKMGLKFNNPSDVKEGGVAYLNIDNSKKFMPFHKLGNLNLDIQFSGFEPSKFDIKALVSVTNFGDPRKKETTVEMNQKCKDSQCKTRIRVKNVAEVDIVTDFDTDTPPFNIIPTRTQIEVKLVDKNMKMGFGEGEIYFAFEDKPETRIRFHANRFEGALQGKTISGHKSVKNGKHQVEIKYNGRALLQLELERKSSIVMAKYSISGGSVASGKFRYKKDEKDQLRIQLKEDKWMFKPRLDITFKGRKGGFTIESRKGGLLLWKDTIAYNVTRGGIDIETHLEISPYSNLYKLKERVKERGNKWGKYLFDKERTNRFSIWSEKSNAQNLLPKIKSSFKFENDVGGLFNIKLDSISKVFWLDVDFVDHSLQLSCDQTLNGKHGQTIKNKMSYNGEEYLKLDISTKNKMDGNSFSILSRFDYMPQREGTGIDFKLVSQSENQTRIEVKAQKMRQELCNYVLDTKLLNTQTDSEIALNDTLNFRQSNLLEKYLPTHALNPKMKDFVRFNQQKSVLNMKISKEQKHAKAKGSIEQDGEQSLDFLINTEKEPFVFRIKTPRRKGSLESMGITVTHKLGQYIELKSDYPYFKGFRINKIGRNKQEIVWNGENMGIMEMKGTIADEVKSTLRSIEHVMAHIFENISKMEEIPRILKDGIMILLVWIDLTWEQYAELIIGYMKQRTTEPRDLILPILPVLIMTN